MLAIAQFPVRGDFVDVVDLAVVHRRLREELPRYSVHLLAVVRFIEAMVKAVAETVAVVLV